VDGLPSPGGTGYPDPAGHGDSPLDLFPGLANPSVSSADPGGAVGGFGGGHLGAGSGHRVFGGGADFVCAGLPLGPVPGLQGCCPDGNKCKEAGHPADDLDPFRLEKKRGRPSADNLLKQLKTKGKNR